MDRRDVMDVLLRLRRYAESGRDEPMPPRDLVSLGTILMNMSQHFMSRAEQSLAQDTGRSGVVLKSEIDEARLELDEARVATEEAAEAILSSAERLMSLEGCPAEVSEEAMRIMTACSFQDLAGQRMSKVSDVLARMEAREAEPAKSGNVHPITARKPATGPLGAHPTDALAKGPVALDAGIDQDTIDQLLEAM